MRRRLLLTVPVALVAAAAIAAPGAVAGGVPGFAGYHECQHPVTTGVEVSHLQAVKPARACKPALALYKWENASPKHANALYGCHYPQRNAAGYPFLRLHKFDGWKLSMHGKPYGAFVMTRGKSSFWVSGTDFPLNCT
jgi:hypothetical protein